MVQDVKAPSYRGVICRLCRQPIPLPAIILNLEKAAERDSRDSRQEMPVRVFHLRCRACQKEQMYWSTEASVFEGTPRSALSRDRSAHTLSRHPGDIAKAANA